MLTVLRSLPWIRPALEMARLGAFVLLVALGLWILWRERRRLPARPAKVALIAFALLVTTVTGFSQIEAWPFSTWALVHHVSQKQMVSWAFIGRDAQARSYPIDIRFMQPLPPEDFGTWMTYRFMRLGRTDAEAAACLIKPMPPTPQQAVVSQFLLERMESARRHFLDEGRPGTNGWLLGPVAAPYHFGRPRVWINAADVPSTPFVGFEIWQDEWDLEERWRDDRRVRRRLIYRYPA